MATPRRRSSRLQNPTTPGRLHSTSIAKLSSLLERDESPAGICSNIDAVVATPIAPPNSVLSQHHAEMPSCAIKTPPTATRVTFGEMHPSKVHQSTIKPLSVLRSHAAKDGALGAASRPTTQGSNAETPMKRNPRLPKDIRSPTFEFSFERHESGLSAEAQKIMGSVRDQAAKIKAQMVEERARQNKDDQDTCDFGGVTGRKVIKPKGKIGRFSDVHKQQFSKMDSIVSHTSTWKSKAHANTTKSLKRSPSKAGLDQTTPKSITKSKSMRSFHDSLTNPMENSFTGKRVKRGMGDDASSARPLSRDHLETFPKSQANANLTAKLPSAAITPTKASLARSASVKDLKTPMPSSLSRSASTKGFKEYHLLKPKTEGSGRYATSLSRFGGNMKSILGHTQPNSSKDFSCGAVKIHSSLPKATFTSGAAVPSLPSSPVKDEQQITPSPTIKRVNFSATSFAGYPKLSASSSLSRIPKLQDSTDLTQEAHVSELSSEMDLDGQVSYPLLATSPNITTRRPLLKPALPGDFTFRANDTIEFSPNKLNSPGGTTIRVVRPSGFPTPMTSSFAVVPSIAHGMSNKKRKHDTDTENDDATDANNKEESYTSVHADEDKDQPRAKRQRMGMTSTPSIQAQATNQSPLKRRFVNRAAGGGANRIHKKGGMSLARLSALARPKERL